ncbi:hypothetical protein ACFWHT_12435 [Microbacterium sp. NPDC058342]|uniref:hypothetical protein n=1 Tax=Microbacterium sp. NPDC058342 TaxID=3346454 RepID=UPI003653C5A7
MNTEPTQPFTGADETLPVTEEDAGVSAPVEDAAAQPRTRWAAIVWGLFFAALAWGGIWMLSSGDRRSALTDWFAGMTPGTITAVALLSLGVLALIGGLAGLIRQGQRRWVSRR